MSDISAQFEVKLEAFQGPFDLLYELITSRELDIYEVPLAQITKEYLEYIRRMSEIDINLAGEFLLIAVVLMELKSKSLFPRDVKTEDVELLDPLEARELLVQRLVEYKTFKNAAAELLTRHDAFCRYFPREVELEEAFRLLKPDFIIGQTSLDLREAYLRLVREHVSAVDASHMTNIRYTVEEQAASILSSLRAKRKQTFRELTSSCRDRMEIIFAFLAILELMKSGSIECSQFQSFGEIEVDLTARLVETIPDKPFSDDLRNNRTDTDFSSFETR